LAERKDVVASAIVRAQTALEEALSELEKIPAFDASSTTFAAHALNNYLTVTGGTVELLLARLADHPDAELRVWLEGVQHATNLMVRIVVQLMNTSAPADVPVRLEPFDLTTLVQRACNFYQRLAGRKSIRVVAGSAGDVPPVWADRVLAAAVLDNLVSNAVKYSPPGKQVSVRVRGEADWAVCDVLDEGPGLSQEDQAKLFQRGVRLTPRPTGGEPSTGYGLAVARDLIGRLGGAIWCESAPGQGACFSFRLPAYREPPAPGSQGVPSSD
jgi:two-component system, sensor histidine kinase and response regulator